ncbi:outer membrane protein assembly factor BamB family protein [Coleofasciculus sp. G2-EDA-02]|uniref:outer membrane protein assembly factor BamB family protein n=1 Tax=Coleofasciculus sp. G2-EDA-02 TaxID=3069529 RepID=UPI0032FB9A9E
MVDITEFSSNTLSQLRENFALNDAELSQMSEDQFMRLMLKLEYPDRPRARLAYRELLLRNDSGEIPPNAFAEAYRQLQEMQTLQPEQGQVAGMPVGQTQLPWDVAAIAPGPGLNPDNTGWTYLGPGNIGGRVRSIVIDPQDPQLIWVGSIGGGVWRTNDGGQSWDPADDLMLNLAVCSLVMNPTNNKVLYAGTGEGFGNSDAIRGDGIFKTTDGWNWQQLESTKNNQNFYYVNRLDISHDGKTILAATNTGIFRSTDGGEKWEHSLKNIPIGRVVFDPTDSSKAIAGGNQGAGSYYSTDGGQTWKKAIMPSNSIARIDVTYAKKDSSIVYASVQMSNNSSQLWQSTDGGESYKKKTSTTNFMGQQGWYNNIIWAGDPNNSNFVVVGGIDLWKSTDGGNTLVKISQWDSDKSAHADHHIITAHPGYNGTSNKIVYFGNDGGVCKTDDIYTVTETNGWIKLNNKFGVTQFYSGAGNSKTKTIIGGAQDNGTLSYTTSSGTNQWKSIYGGDGGIVAADPSDLQTFYGEYVRLSVFRNTNGATSKAESEYICGQFWNRSKRDWKPAPYTIEDAKNGTALFIAPFILDPNNSNCLLAGGLSLWRTNDAKTPNTNNTGPQWRAIKAAIPSNNCISAIAVAPANSDLIFVGHTNGEIYQTDNGTANLPNWKRIDNQGITPIGANRSCTCIAIDSGNSNIIYTTFGGYEKNNVWKSIDGGENWSDIGSSLPAAPIYWITIHPQDSKYVYIATEVGIFASEDAGKTWSPTNQGPTNCAVYQLFWLDNTLCCATHGRGMFQIDLTIYKQADYILVGDLDGKICSLEAQSGNKETEIAIESAVTATINVDNETAYFGAGSKIYSIHSRSLDENWEQYISRGTVDAMPEIVNIPQLAQKFLCATTSTGYLYAFDLSNGSPLWNINVLNLPDKAENKIFCNLVMNEWCYIASEMGVYAVNLRTRTLVWHQPIFSNCSLMLAANTVFVPGEDGILYALHPRSGEEKWKFENGNKITTKPVWILGNVFIGDTYGNIIGLNFRTGEKVIKVTQPGKQIYSMVAQGNILYAIGNAISGVLYAYEVKQSNNNWLIEEKWFTKLPMGAAQPAIVVEGSSTLYVNALNQRTYAFDISDGNPANRLKWEFTDNRIALVSPTAVYPVT